MTRYPRRGRGQKWTALELKAIPPSWGGDILSDGGGLSGEVRATESGAVSVRFRFAFKKVGKVAWHQCGTWPTVTLEAVRAERDRARELVRAGVNPMEQKKAERIDAQAKVEATIANAAREEAEKLPVRSMFNAWLADGVARLDGNAELRRSFDKDVLPAIGEKPVKGVTEHDLRALLRVMVGRGVNRMAVRVYNDLVQMFAWAEKRQPWRGLLFEGNPMELVEIDKVLPAGVGINEARDRTLSAEEIRELRAIFATMESAYAEAPDKRGADHPVRRETQLAMWLCLSTCCRIGELLKSRWENVNLDTGEWFVPAQDTKTKTEWRVYLSDFALRQFKALHEVTGETEWCFPARSIGQRRDGAPPASLHVCVKSVSKQIGDRQMQFKNRKPLKHRRHDNTLVLAEGKNGEWTPHDLRRTAATMMQALRVSPEVIDRCQNHVLAGSKVRRHYLHHDYAEEKREAWRLLGARLEALLQGAQVIPLRVRIA